MFLKELFIVLVLATAVFVLARPLCLQFMHPGDFVRRRNLWLFLTLCAFVSPSFWIYAGIAGAATVWVARRDSNPVVLYMLLFAIIPNLSWYIGFIGINQLLDLSESRLLAIVLLVPLSLKVRQEAAIDGAPRWTWIDAFVIAYVLLQVVLLVPYETLTTTMRRAVLLVLDIVVVYYVMSRALNRREKIVDAMAVFVLVGAVAAAIGLFESLKGWLMYEGIGPRWGASNLGAFLLRIDALRAQAAHGHSLTYGYVLSMAFGFWLHLRNHVQSRPKRWATTILLCAGIYVSHSRGPWFTAIAVYLFYLLLSPGGAAALLKGVAAMAFAGLAFLLTPAGERAFSLLPFIGTLDQDNVTYRQQLATESWRLIWQNPFFGDPFVLRHMEDLRTGQGIIDLMNGYASVALFSGLVGLALFALFFFGALAKALAALRRLRRSDPDLSSLGAALVASMLGSAVFIATASIDWVEYVLVGMAAAYAALALRQSPVVVVGSAHPVPPTAGFRRKMTY